MKPFARVDDYQEEHNQNIDFHNPRHSTDEIESENDKAFEYKAGNVPEAEMSVLNQIQNEDK